MTDDILMAIRAIEKIRINSCNYSFVYLFATENIRGFTQKINFKNNKVLTICSSGDQAFNLILNGATDIDLVDINIFTKYYFYFKKAAIETLSYNEFLNFFFPKFINNQVFDYNTYLKIRTNIKDDEIRTFWDYLFSNYNEKVIYNSDLFSSTPFYKKDTLKTNDYLLTKDNYNKLKLLLKNKTFNFYHLNLFKEQLPTNDKYDFIYLSNIFDYLNIQNKLQYVNKIKEIILNMKQNLTEEGIIAVSYLYLYCDDYWLEQKSNSLYSREIRMKYFNDWDYMSFPGFYTPHNNNPRNKDALMLYRKKTK